MRSHLVVATLLSLLLHIIVIYLLSTSTNKEKPKSAVKPKAISAYIVNAPVKKEVTQVTDKPTVLETIIQEEKFEKSKASTEEENNSIKPKSINSSSSKNNLHSENETARPNTSTDLLKSTSSYFRQRNNQSLTTLAEDNLTQYRQGYNLSENYVKPKKSVEELESDENTSTYKIKGVGGIRCVQQKRIDYFSQNQLIRGSADQFGTGMSIKPCTNEKEQKAQAYKNAMEKWVRKPMKE
ncbi:hypothetical protein J3L16_04685 [Alteromonas sp. 5E99-2]|uniref:hypothetical protein n=1 Tax=Alteromonas sp. 5E99-2 TaxID=2817683 RepID=UPI001A99B018|nr:hypothetical protein [Alteromonas sp. 5E99-2]MBO1254984.1 hypothetical protein [Alteromonas sp. 5E99-2]